MDITFNTSSLSLPLWLLATFGFLIASIITYVAIPSIITVALTKNLCAIPNGRTSHDGSVPNLGGLALFTGLVISILLVAGNFFDFELGYIISGLIVLFMVGMKDDILILDPKKKLVAQILTTILISVFADIRISNFHGLFGLTEVPYLVSILVTIFVFIVIINGFNLIDGIDGLAAGIGILSAALLGIWFWQTGNVAYTVMSFAFIGSLMAFFRFNVFGKHNKIFLGDTGSLIIGLVMSVLTVKFLQLDLVVDPRYFVQSAPAVAVGILIIPLFDTLRVFTIRIWQGKSPFHADRQHIHHRLLQLGFSHLQATLILLGVNLFFVALCFALQQIGILWLMLVIVATASLLSRMLMCLVHKKSPRVVHSRYVSAEKPEEVYQKRKALWDANGEPSIVKHEEVTTSTN